MTGEELAVVAGLELRVAKCRHAMDCARRLAADMRLEGWDRESMAEIAMWWALRLRWAELAYHHIAPAGFRDDIRPAIYRSPK